MSHFSSTIVSQLTEAQAGSRDAIGTVLEAFRPYLLKVARNHLSGNLSAKGGASDLVQETFLEAVRDFERFNGTTEVELRAWLKCLLVHHAGKLRRCYQTTRKRQVSRELSIDAFDGSSSGMSLAAQYTSPSGRAAVNERVQVIERAIARLPEDFREVIRLRYREQRSLDEIAALTGRTPNHVAVLWYRATRRIREELGAVL
jgi:RNA polymerase sigma-70 factor, ECF subfamily